MSTETDRLPLAGAVDRFLRWVVYPNLWVASGITSLMWFVQQCLGLPLDWRPLVLIFSIALIPYILDRVVDTVVQPMPDRRRQLFRGTRILLLLGMAVTVTGILIGTAPMAVRWVCCGVIVPVIYGLPIFPKPEAEQIQWYRLKDVPGLKAWIVCLTITYGVLAVPVAYGGRGIDAQVLLTGLFLLMFVGTNSHVFDVRDLESDRETGVQTMPVLVGVGGTRVILTCLNGVMVSILASAWLQGIAAPDPRIVISATAISLGYLWVLTPETPRNAYDFWIDGCLFLPALLQGIL